MADFFDDAFLNRLRDAADIADVIGGYVRLKQRSRGDYWGQCPFHTEKTPSFHVVSDRGMFHCFGCGKGGNVFTFLMEMEGVSFVDAVKSVAERVGIEVPKSFSSPAAERSRNERDRVFSANITAAKWFHDRLASADAARRYLEKRGITDDIIRRYQIGWTDASWDGLIKHAARSGISGHTLFQAGLASKRKDETGFVDRFRARIMFPILNLSGKPVAFGGRRLEGVTPEDEAKYVNSPETLVYKKGEHLYGLYQARDEIRRSGFAYLVEGYTDLLAMVRAGVVNTTASLGTALTREQSRLLGRFASRVHIVYDADEAGMTAAMRAADILTVTGLETRLVMLPPGEDPDSLVGSRGEEGLQECLAQDRSFIEFRLSAAGAVSEMSQAELLGVARSILKTINEIHDPQRKDQLIWELSSKSGIGHKAIYDALAGLGRSGAETDRAPQKPDLKFAASEKGERDLIMALLAFPNLGKECFPELSNESITNSHLRAVYQALERGYILGERIDAGALLERFSDPAIQSFISSAVVLGGDAGEEAAREAVRTCVLKIKRDSIRRRKQALELRMRQAQGSGEPTRELIRESAELDRKIRELPVE